uniref:anaerobic ribonucleoside-triphosphate reductase n=1 Tax=Hominenteromicrobium sp. TaxID=3073581 RepID=UPI003A95C92F
ALRDDKYRSSMTGFAIVPRKPNIPPTCVITASSAIAQNSCMAITIVGEGRGFDRIRRITGYLVGTTDRWNDAKRAEEHDRVKHSL